MANKPSSLYWLSMVTWEFGSWKTFWIECELYRLKSENPDTLIIANIPISITDRYYNSVEDFKKVVDFIYRFYAETNADTKKYDKHRKDIVLVMDEAQIYFPARGFADKDKKELWDKLIIVLTQCRKRYTKFRFATQRTKMVDLNFRRLADYIYFCSIVENRLFKVSKLNVYQCGGGVSDLLWEDWVTWETEDQLEESNVYSWFWRHNTTLLDSFLMIENPKWNLWKEKHVTKHICWLFGNYFNCTYEEFKKSLYLTVKDVPLISIYNQDNIPLCYYWKKTVDLYWDIVNFNEVNEEENEVLD